MKPKSRRLEQNDLLRPRLIDMIDMRHELVKLAALIDWEFFEAEWAGFFPSHTGRPATSPRLVAGLLYLQHSYRLSDEAVVARWVENPYYQHFCGETFFQHRFPLDPSSLTRWRKRIGEEGVEWLLTKTIEAGRKAGVISERSVEAVIVDTTVMEKAIAHPTDARLYEKARKRLVALAQEADLSLRQSYARLAPRLSGQVGRYAHARQFKRMRKALRRLKGYTGRVMRDIQRQLGRVTDDQLRQRIEVEIALADRLLRQKPKDKGKLYALHEPEVDCISKGKARARYEFGTKVSVATTHKEGFVVGMRSMPGNPYDGHTLREALEQVEILTEIRPKRAFVDRGYRGSRLSWTRGPDHRGLHRRTKARDDPGASARPAPTQRDRANDRSHENGWSSRALRPQGHARRRAPRRPVRLRAQHPHGTGPPQGSLGPNPGGAPQRIWGKGKRRQI